MNALLMSTVVALGIGQPAAGAADGKWVIVYAEDGGRRNNAWEQRLAMCSKGVLSYEDATGKKLSLSMKLGADNTLDATVSEAAGGKDKVWHGVYILGQDYLSICLNKGARKSAGPRTRSGAATGTDAVAPVAVGGGGAGADFILILRRQRAGGAKGADR